MPAHPSWDTAKVRHRECIDTLQKVLKLRKRGRLMALPQTLASFRWHPDSATVKAETESMEESDQLRMKYMPRPLALGYQVLRWPGRWALVAAKRRVDHNTRKVATSVMA